MLQRWEKDTAAVTHSTEIAKLCLGQSLCGCQFNSGMERLMWEAVGPIVCFLQRVSGHRQKFWTSSRISEI